jgi:protein-S-isoprenylcysteine O-methyltransferase Ste14
MDKSIRRIIFKRGIISLAVMWLVIFGCAGRLDYWPGWVFFILSIAGMAISFRVYTDMPDLVRERIKPGPGIKPWDRVILGIFIGLYIIAAVLAVLDGGRFKWSGALPWWVNVIGFVIYLSGTALSMWAVRVNRFFSSVVRIQSDRGHTVVMDGPYRRVRHPGYVAGIMLGPGLALAFGSLWALIPAGLMVLVLIIRTWLADRTLQRELPGYVEYAEKVPYRLAPGIW